MPDIPTNSIWTVMPTEGSRLVPMDPWTQGAALKKKAKKMKKTQIKSTPEPAYIDGARVFNVNKVLLENPSAAYRFIHNSILPKVHKGQAVHMRMRKNISTVKVDKVCMFLEDILAPAQSSKTKVGISFHAGLADIFRANIKANLSAFNDVVYFK